MKIERYDDDFTILRGFLSDTEQDSLLATIKSEILGRSRLQRPLIGKQQIPMRIEMACAGDYEWRTQPRFHYAKQTGVPIPAALREANDRACDLADITRIRQETALINLYRDADGRQTRLGMHRDEDEATAALGLTEPAVISLSLGPASALFAVELDGGVERLTLHGGDACFLVGRSRRARHGVERIDGAWRVNVTTRQVHP